LGLFGITVLSYLVLAGFLYLNEQKAEEILSSHESTLVRIQSPHKIELIDDGLASFKRRLDLIDSAKESIELEFFIYELDLAARLISDKLVSKANQGVKVRLMVDFSAPVFKLKPQYANFLKKNGVEVKYYNTSSLLELVAVQHRNHRKFLIIDGKYALTGGRNVANDYFNLSSHYSFLDSDILIDGPIVSNIRSSFNLYWNSEYTVSPETFDGETPELDKLINNLGNDRKLYQDLEGQKETLYSSIHKTVCNDLTFVMDFPGVTKDKRQTFKAIAQALQTTKSKVLAESPYFVILHGGLKVLEDLSRRDVKVDVLTNGLYSTDAYYTVSALSFSIDELVKTNLSLHAYNGNVPGHYSSRLYPTSKRWGIHSKRAVIDDKTVMIGTYNIDPRSANLNSEVVFICHEGVELASLLTESIRSRIAESDLILSDGKVHEGTLIKKAPFMQKLKYLLAMPLTFFFDFLL